ncbi:peptidoglycan-binding domain-containing protein [Pseudomonas segetis]|uniref:Putative peptidoglycan binding domain-containing protein n=1 Tax=Pseudomonas segetis TaxID=298908 RepID=A0A239FPL7_9PSED|nr:peptidoglycan-binding domain-containing protein [Pseudomonas segetis]SNS58976.1 Putative peptidoglycan binding domain-containing protein [Pseudomonas segetis]
MKYGNFNLRRGDHDGNTQQNTPPRWSGIDNPAVQLETAETGIVSTSSSAASLTVPEHVRLLQEDLQTLGFAIIGSPDGSFGKSSEWAVREFQIYARMPHVARVKVNKIGQLLLTATGNPKLVNNNEVYYDSSAHIVAKAGQLPNTSGTTDELRSYYVDSLEQTTNGHLYTGPVSGVVDSDTRTAIEFWLENHYRCPVVIEAWSVSNTGARTLLSNGGSNLWKYDSFTSSAPRIFARDFTQYYTYPSTRSASQYQAIGYYDTQGGPNATKKHSWSPEAEMTVENMLGTPANPEQLNSTPLSVYRVIRVVAEAECYGRFDVINAWDNSLISAGPCHWTMGASNGNEYEKAEFPAFIAYFLRHYEVYFKKVFGNFGLYPEYEWGDEDLYSSSTLTYTSWLKLTNETHQPSQLTYADTEFTPLSNKKPEANYLKNWHWIYRISMAGRTISEYRQAMWEMAKLRVLDIRKKSVEFQVGTNTINSTLGEVFTSEKAVAILLRWHVYRPSHVVHPNYERITTVIQSAINNNPLVSWHLQVSNWEDIHESVLTEHLLTAASAVNNSILTSILFGSDQPQGSVRTGRDTFLVDA